MKTKLLPVAMVCFLFGWGLAITPALIAETYPDRPIQLVIPNTAGSMADITARLLASELEKIIGQKIIPNNKPGASTVLGTDAVVRGKKDGYTLLYASASSLTYAPITNPEIVRYDPAKDLEPMGLHFLSSPSLNVRFDSPWKTFPDFVDHGKKNPRKLRVATSGVGHPTHFMLEVIQAVAGIQLIHVPFEGGESVTTALLGGHVEASCDAFSKQKPYTETQKLRVLLITYKSPAFPEVPTISEFGYKQSLPSSWFALFAPTGIPEDVKKVLVPAIEKAAKNTKPKIEQMGGILEYKSPSEFRKMWETEYQQIFEIASRIGLRKK